MKTTAKNVIREEGGKILILVLVLLVVGGLLLGPLLGLMSTGLVAGQVYEKKAAELYAADAGVEEAIWKITNPGLAELPHSACRDVAWSRNYTIADVNGKEVQFTIDYLGGEVYTITSQATVNGSGTKIEALVLDAYQDYGAIPDHILCSQKVIDCHQDVKLDHPPANGEYPYYPGPWPTADIIRAWYLEDVKNATHYHSDTMNLDGADMDLEGPVQTAGPLQILNNCNKNEATLTLYGTLYITGDARVGMDGQGNKPRLTIDLNGNTIFVAGNSTKSPASTEALQVGDWCKIVGPGAIVAVGDIYFSPKGDVGGNGEPVFIISVEGKTTLKPSGAFYGAIAGSVEVQVYSGADPGITYPKGGFPDDLNWPGFLRDKWAHYIASWTVGPA